MLKGSLVLKTKPETPLFRIFRDTFLCWLDKSIFCLIYIDEDSSTSSTANNFSSLFTVSFSIHRSMRIYTELYGACVLHDSQIEHITLQTQFLILEAV